MVGNLFREHTLKGMGRTEIVELLGLPALNDKWEGSEMIYLLAPDRGLVAIGHEWLLIELDKQDRVSSYRLVSD